MAEGGVPFEDRELRAALRRFYELSSVDQLRAYHEMRKHLREVAHHDDALDAEVEQKLGSLDAMEAVAKSLGLSAGTAPKSTEFDAAAKELGLPWNKSRIIRIWGAWRLARTAYERPRRTRGLTRRPRASSGGAREDYLAAVRRWLATKPSKLTVEAYTDWAREENGRLEPGAKPVPLKISTTLLKVNWDELVAVADGRKDASEIGEYRRRIRRKDNGGPHDLIGFGRVAEIFGVSGGSARKRVRQPDFPAPVVIYPAASLWRRTDVEAYAAGQEVPQRQEDELGHLYLSAREVAERLGLSRSLVNRGSPRVPPPAVVMSGISLWLREEVERYEAKTQS